MQVTLTLSCDLSANNKWRIGILNDKYIFGFASILVLTT